MYFQHLSGYIFSWPTRLIKLDVVITTIFSQIDLLEIWLMPLRREKMFIPLGYQIFRSASYLCTQVFFIFRLLFLVFGNLCKVQKSLMMIVNVWKSWKLARHLLQSAYVADFRGNLFGRT